MQLWQQVCQQKGSINERARLYARMMAAPPAVAAAVDASRIRADMIIVPANEQPQAGQYVVLQCNCAHAHCCKVLNYSTVYEGVRRGGKDPMACPAEHGSTCATYSLLVERFRPIAETLLPGYWFIWDIHDVPGQPVMHIDMMAVSPMLPGLAHRFEIDGRGHFSKRGTVRQDADWLKDDILNDQQVSMLRLHVADLATWPRDMQGYLLAPQPRVMYTASYARCLV